LEFLFEKKKGGNALGSVKEREKESDESKRRRPPVPVRGGGVWSRSLVEKKEGKKIPFRGRRKEKRGKKRA